MLALHFLFLIFRFILKDRCEMIYFTFMEINVLCAEHKLYRKIKPSNIAVGHFLIKRKLVVK